MTLIILRIDNQLQCIVGLTFITGTKGFMVTTQSTNTDQIATLICSPDSTQYFFIEAILKNRPANHNKFSEREILNDCSQQTFLFQKTWSVETQNPLFECIN